MAWRDTLLQRLTHGQNEDGSWGYGYRSRGAAEATALAALAVAVATSARRVPAALRWLGEAQLDHGGVPVYQDHDDPCWPTALALLLWRQADAGGDVERAERWLVEARGTTLEPRPPTGHDTTIVGWAWAPDTHSWVEPTAYALLALRGVEGAAEARVREGERLLVDRCLPDGGWNYGNTQVLENVTRPFPATTGTALAALGAMRSERTESIDSSIRWLTGALAEARAPLSLGWGLLGLRAWGEVVDDADAWLDASVEVEHGEADPRDDALRLLAGAPRLSFLNEPEPAPEEPVDG